MSMRESQSLSVGEGGNAIMTLDGLVVYGCRDIGEGVLWNGAQGVHDCFIKLSVLNEASRPHAASEKEATTPDCD